MMVMPLKQKFFIRGHFYFSSTPDLDPNGQSSPDDPFSIKIDISSQPGPSGGKIHIHFCESRQQNEENFGIYTSGKRPSPKLQGSENSIE